MSLRGVDTPGFIYYNPYRLSQESMSVMLISQKCQYALRAVYELAYRATEKPVKISDIARAQAIPPRFLEVILNQLKQGGFVASRRGAAGGYILLRSPHGLTVGEIIRFIQGPIEPVGCLTGPSRRICPLKGDCVFMPVWERVEEAISGVYDQTTFQDLMDESRRRSGTFVPSYAI